MTTIMVSDSQRYAETLILTGITVMMVLYGLVAVLAAWIERPPVTLDPETGHWRSARLVHRERRR